MMKGAVSVEEDVDIRKPIVIAAMQDMGNVGSIAIDFINKSLGTRPFRHISIPFPNYVVDSGGYIDFQREKWEYRYGSDGSVVVFGGGMGQPQTNQELYDLCEDVIDVARKYSTQLIYTLGAFHTDRKYGKSPKTFFAATTQELAGQLRRLGLEPTPGSSLITGFNGLILGFAKEAGLQGIGLYAEISDPQVAQFRSAKSLLATLEKLTYQKFRGIEELDEMASRVESEDSGG
ncbi:MAG TPA: PAC2 family protein [Nitrososphaera sp.]|nr:PAC2 family protein [Nitrososphaera sp.]